MASPSASPSGDHDFAHLTDVLGSFPMIRRYSLVSLFFSLPELGPSIQTAVEHHLRQSLAALARDVPWLAGRVVFEGRDESHSGIRKIVPHDEGGIPLLIKDLCSPTDGGGADQARFPSFSQLHDANFPAAFLDPAAIVPPIAVCWTPGNLDGIAPVLVLQASFVRGGMVLTINSNHTTMDMTGLGIVIGFIAKLCRGEHLTAQEIALANQDRRHAVPLLGDDYQPGPELDDLLVRPQSEQPTSTAAAKQAKWAYFNFSSASLQELKQEASKQHEVPYITTDDAITALCWQRTQAARRVALGPAVTATAESELCRPISMRKILGLDGYTGHVVDCFSRRHTDVDTLPLGVIAGSLRAVLRDEHTLRHHVRAFATLLDRLDDKSVLVSGALLDPRRDLVVSSHSNLRSCGESFGPLLGTPLAARRPRMQAWPGLVYLMPRDVKGDTAVAFCLAEDEIELLRRDEMMARYSVYVG